MARLLVIISILCLMTCSSNAYASAHTQKHSRARHNYSLNTTSLPYFNGIDVDDNIHLVILNSESRGQRISKSASDRVSAEIEGDTLVLRRIPDPTPRDEKGHHSYDRPMYHQEPVTITVWTHNLCFLRASEFARVMMEDVSTCYGINVVATDNAQVKIRGTINLKNLTTRGNSCVNAMWVDSCHVKMCSSDNSKVVLAGFTCILDAALNSCSSLDARFLRSKEVFIKTTDYACAKVLPIFALYGFAKHYSGVYYYKTPAFITRNSTESGNILQMEYWN
jgi:hypothetical protein